MDPITILDTHLRDFERNLEKSTMHFKAGIINKKMHESHVKNLLPKIEEFKQAIIKLKS
mgnify:CR=1 FL=1